MKILKHLVLAAILVLAIASLAQATETWNFTPVHNVQVNTPATYLSTGTIGGIQLIASGFDTANNVTALYQKFTTGDPTETGLGMASDPTTEHEIYSQTGTGHHAYVQLNVLDLTNHGLTGLTLTISSVQSG
jgi:hypothetical protein